MSYPNTTATATYLDDPLVEQMIVSTAVNNGATHQGTSRGRQMLYGRYRDAMVLWFKGIDQAKLDRIVTAIVNPD